MKTNLKKIGITVVSIIALIAIIFITGEGQAIYNKTVGKDIKNSENVQFHQTQMYTDGKANDLAKAKRELATTTDETARESILNYINETYANFNANQLQDASLRQFLIDVRNGSIK